MRINCTNCILVAYPVAKRTTLSQSRPNDRTDLRVSLNLFLTGYASCSQTMLDSCSAHVAHRPSALGAIRIKVLPVGHEIRPSTTVLTRLGSKWLSCSHRGRFSVIDYLPSVPISPPAPGIYVAPQPRRCGQFEPHSLAKRRAKRKHSEQDLSSLTLRKSLLPVCRPDVSPSPISDCSTVMENEKAPDNATPLQCLVAVIGLCSAHAPDSAGVGKSSLCSRFVRPAFDDYSRDGEVHDIGAAVRGAGRKVESIGELAGGEDMQHWLYFGSRTVNCADGKVPIEIHLIERTIVAASRTCSSSVSLSVDSYAKFVSSEIPRPQGKTTYRSADRLTHGAEGAHEVPSAILDRQADGFIFVLDLSQDDSHCQSQLQLLEACLVRLGRSALLAVAIVKGDSLGMVRLSLVEHGDFRSLFPDARRKLLASRLHQLPWFSVSARLGVGVDEAFCYIAEQTHIRVISRRCRPPRRSVQQPLSLVIRERRDAIIAARANMRKLLRESVFDFATQWSKAQQELETREAFVTLAALQGKDECLRSFQLRLLEIKMTGEMSSDSEQVLKRCKAERTVPREESKPDQPCTAGGENDADAISDELIWDWCELVCSHHGHKMRSWAEHPDLKPLLDRSVQY